ncbi:MAG TPA: ribosome biogenesis GTPase Der [Gammaproteobacteria bacterium]|nr:ribosome biogenesis GTPase Der [Gammaproteobacteria bacterium]
MTIISLIGRPNVGKSSLFNALVGKRQAIVSPISGVTRDRHTAEAVIHDQTYLLVDTAGLTDENSTFNEAMKAQSEIAMITSDVCLWVIDHQTGLSYEDQAVLNTLRKQGIPCWLIVNKVDDRNELESAKADYYSTGMSTIFTVSCKKKNGLESLKSSIAQHFPPQSKIENNSIKIALIGKPNVGKSTLVNACVREDRVIVSDIPGTTRDSVELNFTYQDQAYTIIDTAGLKRKTKINDTLDRYASFRTLASLKKADAVIFLADGTTPLSAQDQKLLDLVVTYAKPLVIAINKTDLDCDEFDAAEGQLDLYKHLWFIPKIRISARNKKGIGRLLKEIKVVYDSSTPELSTSQLTELLEKALEQHQPPLVGNRRIKPRLAHPIGVAPPIRIGITGKQLNRLPNHYKQYLQSYFQKSLKISGTCVEIEFKQDLNPYSK